jgi:L-amino acid N-acyltransferase YncA
MAVEFTHARETDLARIVATYNNTIPSRLVTADLEPVTAESRRTWFREHSEGRRPLWLVLDDQRYAGWMSFSSFYGRPAYDGTVEVSIYIDQPFRGKGLGKACLEHAIKKAPGLGIHTLLGFIFGHNQPSLRLFEKEGFSTWARLPGVANMEGEMRDLLILGRKV